MQLPLTLYGAESHQIRHENLDKRQLSRVFCFFFLYFILFLVFNSVKLSCVWVCPLYMQLLVTGVLLKVKKGSSNCRIWGLNHLWMPHRTEYSAQRIFKDVCVYPQHAWITSNPLCPLHSCGTMTQLMQGRSLASVEPDFQVTVLPKKQPWHWEVPSHPLNGSKPHNQNDKDVDLMNINIINQQVSMEKQRKCSLCVADYTPIKFSDFPNNFDDRYGRGSWCVAKHAYIIPPSLTLFLICPLFQHHRSWSSCSFEHLSLWFQINKTGN